MATISFNEDLVNQAIDTLQQTKSTMSNASSGMTSGLSLITGARGAQYVDSSALQAGLALDERCSEQIDELIQQIREKAEQIKAYNAEVENIPWWQRALSTIGLGLTKFTEGFFTAGEQIVDGFASALGFVAGIFNSDWQDGIGEFIKKDHVGDFYDSLYDNELSGMVKASYMKEDGIAAKIFEIGGTAVGYAVAIAAGGAAAGAVSGAVSGAGVAAGASAGAAAASSSMWAGAAWAGLGGFGAGTQAGLQAGLDYNAAAWEGVKSGE